MIIFVLIDYYSRLTRFIPIRGKDFDIISKALDCEFEHYGIPMKMRSDNGPPMNSENWLKHYESMGIIVEFSTPAHPQGNGLVERQMQTLKTNMAVAWMSNKAIKWSDQIKKAEKIYNATPHKTTSISPAQMMLNRKPRIGIPCTEENLYRQFDYESIARKVNTAKEYQKQYSDSYRRARHSTISIGDLVYVKKDKKDHKLEPQVLLDGRRPRKFTVVSRKGNDFGLKELDGLESAFHRDADMLIKCPKSRDEELHDEIVDDFLSANPTRDQIGGVTSEYYRSIANNNEVIHEELREALTRRSNSKWRSRPSKQLVLVVRSH